MTTPFSPLPLVLLTAATAGVQASSPPALLPAGLAPAGLRLQATFAAARPDHGMAVFGPPGHGQLHHAGSDLGNGLQLLRVLADRVVLGHGGREYYLPLLAAPASTRLTANLAGERPVRATASPLIAAGHRGPRPAAAASLQANNLDEVRQQCHSSTMAQLSAAQRQEIQALGLCP